jgi:uncharacterized protein YegJ (DUF2314 family)
VEVEGVGPASGTTALSAAPLWLSSASHVGPPPRFIFGAVYNGDRVGWPIKGDVCLTLLSKFKSLLGFAPAERPLISVVLHFHRPMPLPDEVLHTAITRSWGRDVRKDLNEHIVNRPPICFIKFEGAVLMLSNVRKPYCPAEYLEQALSEFPELRQKKVVKEHKAFLSIDLQSPEAPRKSVKDEWYRRMCRLAAEFVDANCMGVYFPETRHLRPYDGEVKNALRSQRPLQEMTKWGEPPVVLIEEDDPRLQAAVGEAQLRWPDFVQAFQRRRPNQNFSVKALFTDGEHGEWMWVVVSAIKGEAIQGKLGNTPVEVRGLHVGDPVTIQASEIGDWVYGNGKEIVGGFSLSPPERR